VLLHQAREARQLGRARGAHALGNDAGRDVDAVQDVADVVQDAVGDFRHAGAARGLDHRRARTRQLLQHALELARQDADLVLAPLGEVDVRTRVLALADAQGVVGQSAKRRDHDALQHREHHEQHEQARRERREQAVARGHSALEGYRARHASAHE
jgi:hypothetical protein